MERNGTRADAEHGNPCCPHRYGTKPWAFSHLNQTQQFVTVRTNRDKKPARAITGNGLAVSVMSAVVLSAGFPPPGHQRRAGADEDEGTQEGQVPGPGAAGGGEFVAGIVGHGQLINIVDLADTISGSRT